MRADQVMTAPVITIGPDASIVEAANEMLRHHISGLPVVNTAGELIGIVSEGDFVRRAEIGTQRKRGRWLEFLIGPGRSAGDFVHEQGRRIGEIMTPDPHTIAEETPLEKVAQILEQNNIKRVPVLRGTRLVGIVTRSNLLQAVAHLARHATGPTADDDHIRSSIIATIERASWSPCRLSVMVRDGVVTLGGIVTDERSRKASIVAAENVPGVKQVHDHLCMEPEPEEYLGGGDFVSLQAEPATTDDEPL
jgi:CBS domain-containing protein